MDRHRLADGGSLIHQVAQQRLAKSLAAMFGQEGDVDDAMLGRPALDIEAADVIAAVHAITSQSASG